MTDAFNFDAFHYAWLSILLISFLYFLVPSSLPKRTRIKVYSKEYMAKYDEECKQAGIDVPFAGSPDMGNGQFSDKLTYREWYEYNSYNRA